MAKKQRDQKFALAIEYFHRAHKQRMDILIDLVDGSPESGSKDDENWTQEERDLLNECLLYWKAINSGVYVPKIPKHVKEALRYSNYRAWFRFPGRIHKLSEYEISRLIIVEGPLQRAVVDFRRHNLAVGVLVV